MKVYPAWPNLATMMFDLARTWPERPMLRFWRDGAWQRITWGRFAALTAAAARGFRAAGIGAGDRVLIVSENRPEYPIAEVALLALRAVPVPTYITNTVEDHAHVLRDCGARAAVCANAALAERVAAAGPLDLLIALDDFTVPGVRTLGFGAMQRDAGAFEEVAEAAAAIPADVLACIIYTSGTGGAPKGVMLPHRAVLANCRGAFEHLRSLDLHDEVYLSFLPLSHSYEHTAGQFFLASMGSEIVYARGIEHLAADMLTVRPTIMTIVPRILEVIRARILAQVARERGWRQALFARAIEIGRRRAEGETLSLLDRLLDPVLERLVRRKVRARFGGRFRAAMSGGARLEPEVWRFFLGLGIELMQGYGQTEAGPVISANTTGATRVGTVGRALPGVELRIAADGEILRARRPGDGRLLAPPGRDGGGDPRRLAAYRRHRRAGCRRLPADHRPQEGHDRAVGRRERLARAHRGHAGRPARDRAGDGAGRGTAGPLSRSRRRRGLRRPRGRGGGR